MNGIHVRNWMHPLPIGAIASLFCLPVAAEQASVTVNLSGLRSQEGNVVICLWREQDKDFLMCSDKASFQHLTAKATASTIEVQFQNVPSGDYAISVFHDENQNGKIDRGFMGRPKEGIGVSSLTKQRRGRPSFEKAKFTLNGAKTISLSLMYF